MSLVEAIALGLFIIGLPHFVTEHPWFSAVVAAVGLGFVVHSLGLWEPVLFWGAVILLLVGQDKLNKRGVW